jgi:transposase
MSYSVDLRKCVMNAIRSGMTKSKASQIFNVCQKTIYNWLFLEKTTGSLNPQTDFQKGHPPGITDHHAFKQFVDKHPDYTQEEIAQHFSVGSSTVSRTLQKIGYSRKKRVKHTRKEAKHCVRSTENK